MAADPAGKLYTPQLLSLATELASVPFAGDFPLIGEARSRTCGSSVKIGFKLDEDSTINMIGMIVSACAVGQASAAILASAVKGSGVDDLIVAEREIELWLAQEDAKLPDWPRFAAIESARAFSARHGALVLPWKAAIVALSKADDRG